MLVVKNPPAGGVRDAGLIARLGRSPGVSHSSILPWKIPWAEEPVWATDDRATKNQTRLSTVLYLLT